MSGEANGRWGDITPSDAWNQKAASEIYDAKADIIILFPYVEGSDEAFSSNVTLLCSLLYFLDRNSFEQNRQDQKFVPIGSITPRNVKYIIINQSSPLAKSTIFTIT